MLDIGWWELFVMGMVALLVVGPKELPSLLRTIGRYVGVIKRQADEFRSQFDDAIRDSEFNDLKNEMEAIKSDVSTSVNDAEASIKKDLNETDYDWDDEERIKPAPEFANEEDTTSFTTADGEVITKEGSDQPASSRDETQDPKADAEPAGTQTNEASQADSGSGDKKNARDAEAVR